MKTILQVILLFTVTISFSQNSNFENWNSMAEKDPSLRPEYGNIQKTAEQLEYDQQFINDLLDEYDGNKKEASRKMTELGFQYLYEKGDFVTAMRRFNQAFLVEPDNADIYYGYGTIYFNLGEMDKARMQYDKGLKINSEHSEMLTDYGTTYLGDFYNNIESNKELANERLRIAEKYLNKSYKIDNKNSNTIYKLAVINMYLENCKEAWKYLKSAKKMKNPNVTSAFEIELKTKCEK